MDTPGLLTELFSRIDQLVPVTVDGLTEDQLSSRPAGRGAAAGNSIAWLVWHLSRVQDDHVAAAAGTEQVWAAGWRERFDLDHLLDPDGVGYGHSSTEVAKVHGSADLLAGYYQAVAAATGSFLSELGATDLERIVDTNFDPPVSLGVRLVSVASDCLQHIGQAGYVRGLVTP